ncbi:hypothetical protein DASC09_045730 [Saccharomycopsis crataegensis]|uniref:Calcipressin n=1 Tax=Saccharomycopsis crataegensis TaxID=43959 RepID=A0AAV5QQQ1_9ASCO|nr:hypothetical protein DASC09_045730 [Saccharomycopsis crataegensis]
MGVDPTNTLILTGFTEDELLDTELIKSLQNQIINHTSASETIQFSILKSFKRIIMVFERLESSQRVYGILKSAGFKVGYASQNNYDDFIMTDDGYKFDTREYLHLPSHGTTFIISPPPSPPPGWVSMPEEAPEQRSIYSPEELRELLYKRVDDGKIQRLFDDAGEECEPQETADDKVVHDDDDDDHRVVDQKVLLQSEGLTSPIIVLEAPENEELSLWNVHSQHKKPTKVSMPPPE